MLLIAQSDGESFYIGVAFIIMAGILTAIALLKYDVAKAVQLWAAFGTVLGAMTTFYFTREQRQEDKQRANAAEQRAADALSQLAVADTRADQAKERLVAAESLAKAARESLAQLSIKNGDVAWTTTHLDNAIRSYDMGESFWPGVRTPSSSPADDPTSQSPPK